MKVKIGEFVKVANRDSDGELIDKIIGKVFQKEKDGTWIRDKRGTRIFIHKDLWELEDVWS